MDVTNPVAWLECVARSYVIRLHGMGRPFDNFVCFFHCTCVGGTFARCLGIPLFGIIRIFVCHDVNIAQACTHAAKSFSIQIGFAYPSMHVIAMSQGCRNVLGVYVVHF